MLIFDGFEGHLKPAVINYAIDNHHDIILFCLPVHTSHKTQPLDVGVFGPFPMVQSFWCKRDKSSLF